MDFKINLNEDGVLYRGAVPLFLNNLNFKKIIYISSSNKNIEDYYSVLKDISNKNIIKIENDNNEYTIKAGEKFKFLYNLDNKEKSIILINLETALENYNNKNDYIKIEKNKIIKQSEFIEKIIEAGYEYNYLVEKKGEYSKRGDIIDIYSVHEENPVRLEFFDDYIENIKYFDIETQKSIEKINDIVITPIKNNFEEIDIIQIIEKYNDVSVYIENTDILIYKLEEYILVNREMENIFRERFNKIKEKCININLKRFSNEEIDKFYKMEKLIDYSNNNNVYIFSKNEEEYKKINKEKIKIINKDYFEGFYCDDGLVLTQREIKGVKTYTRINKRKEAVRIKNINQIVQNDYIIHENYGVGIFLGIESIENKDYIKIQYADEDRLYVPIDYINRIEKYISEPGKIPEIYKLGTKGFKKQREKIQKDIEEFALELINIQAKRNMKNGFVFSKDTIWQEEFEDNFPYIETIDQKKAIIDVKNDMESGKIMDRVVCGDVGYGKTEVAMRAAFKCVMDNKQVAVLAPTTVLVNQHYNRFIDRFSKFPVKIEMISRLEKNKKQDEIVNKLSSGEIDIIIGTHRLLSDDINFKDLGLLVVDEEQKFGVKAKEKMKKYRNEINILTLTATPIPRTLNLALLGIKDISIIETPPKNRIPIETKVIKKDKKIIKDIVMKEAARDGQVFYVYNSVKSMEYKVKELEKILPDYIKIAYIHGQMDANKIKDKISKFENNEYNLLLTTTIIENGIDIENVNTIIIENFEKLGLSQIYQLRGRVGRSGKKAYCYLMHNVEKVSTEKGKRKVEVFDDLEELGTGFQLSLEDMNIRGAGEILGERQHGAIETFGYDLYLKLLTDEIKRLKNSSFRIKKEPLLNLNIKYYIPDDYILQNEKLKIYKRIVGIETIEELDDIEKEMEDRFGKMPESVKNLIFYYRIKILAINSEIKEIKEKNEGYYVKFFENNIEIGKINMILLSGEVNYISKESALLIKKEKNILEILQKIKREC